MPTIHGSNIHFLAAKDLFRPSQETHAFFSCLHLMSFPQVVPALPPPYLSSHSHNGAHFRPGW